MSKPKYYNPEGEIKKDIRRIVVNFKTEKDYIDFIKKTQLPLNKKKSLLIKRPTNSIDNFFE